MVLPVLGLALSAVIAPETQRDWGAALRTDASALHAEIDQNHPGPVNPADPGFAKRNDAQYFYRAETRRRSHFVRTLFLRDAGIYCLIR